MIKYLFIVINSLSLFIYSLFSGDNVITVTSTIPSSIVAGQETSFELKVNKGSMTGFAKLQLELPEGITVKESEDKGATYTFEENMARWVWAILPEENEIVIKVVVVASENALGAKTIAAKFSYVEENVKQAAEMTPVELTVVAPGTAPVTVAAEPTTAPVVDSVTVGKTTTALIPGANNEPVGNINAVRTITKVNNKEYMVDLKIKKGITKGFAKYSDDVIAGTTIKPIKTDASAYSIADGKIRFVWVTAPEKEELEISYTISGNFSKGVTLNGEYSYLENNQSKKYKLTPETISETTNSVTANKVKAGTKQPEPVATEIPKEKEPAEQLSTDTPAATNPAVVAGKKDGGTNFVVQIGAFTKGNIDAKTLKQKFKITEKISSEMQDGFSKFMIGAHKEYKDARYHKEVVKDVNGIKSAFVVAYSGSKRVTVQEALMITNQKWFK